MRRQRKQQTQRQRRSAKDWQALVTELDRSGKSVKAFASERRLSAATLSWWRWRLGSGADGGTRADARKESDVLRLLPVEVVREDEAVDAEWEVRFASGHELRVRGALAVAQLEEVLRALLDGGQDR